MGYICREANRSTDQRKKMTKSMPPMKNKNKNTKRKGLIGGQKKLDKNKNGKLDRQDFQMMRKGKGKKK